MRGTQIFLAYRYWPKLSDGAGRNSIKKAAVALELRLCSSLERCPLVPLVGPALLPYFIRQSQNGIQYSVPLLDMLSSSLHCYFNEGSKGHTEAVEIREREV